MIYFDPQLSRFSDLYMATGYWVLLFRNCSVDTTALQLRVKTTTLSKQRHFSKLNYFSSGEVVASIKEMSSTTYGNGPLPYVAFDSFFILTLDTTTVLQLGISITSSHFDIYHFPVDARKFITYTLQCTTRILHFCKGVIYISPDTRYLFSKLLTPPKPCM